MILIPIITYQSKSDLPVLVLRIKITRKTLPAMDMKVKSWVEKNKLVEMGLGPRF